MPKILPVGARLVPTFAKKVFEGEIFDVYQWQQELYDGSHATYEMLKRPDTVCILAVDEQGEIIVTDEEQSGGIVRKNTLPLGRVESGESTLAAAKREMREETGYEFNNWKLIAISQPEKKIEWFVYLYLASEVSGVFEAALDPGERIVVKRADYETVKRGVGKYVPVMYEHDSIDSLIHVKEDWIEV